MSGRNNADDSDDRLIKRMADGEGLPEDLFAARIARMFCLEEWADTPYLMRALARQFRKQADQLDELATTVEHANRAGMNMLISELLSLTKKTPGFSVDCDTPGPDQPQDS